MRASEFDKFLSENALIPNSILMHPSIWNGYWSIKRRPRIISKLFRFLGRKLKSRRLYWIGLSIYWVNGMKTLKEFEGLETEEIIYED